MTFPSWVFLRDDALVLVGRGVHRQRVDVVVLMIGIAGYYLGRIERLYTLFHHPAPPVDKSFYTVGHLPNVSAVLPLGGAGIGVVTWNFLSRGLGLYECLDDFVDFTFLETNAYFLAGFVVRDTDCGHDVCVGPEIGF